MVSGLKPLDPCQPPDLRYLRRLTDEFGVFQHTLRERPLPEFGYAIDDVARALIVAVETERLFPSAEQESPSRKELADRYLRFMAVCQLPDGRFHNGVAADRTFQDGVGSQDAYGRSVWALGVSSARGGNAEMRAQARVLLTKALPHAGDVSYLRSRAFTLLGLLAVLTSDDPLSVFAPAEQLLSQLLHAFHDTATESWTWFEEALWYSNGALPYAVLSAARHPVIAERAPNVAEDARTVGTRSLDFLLRELVQEGVASPVGNRGWYARGGTRPLYDQQAVDVAAMVVAAAEAFKLTAEPRYREAAETWWGWFFGANTQHRPLYRPEDGSVYDGLNPEGVNENRGAESILALLLAHLSFAELCDTRGSG